MPHLPCGRLLLGPLKSIAITGSDIHVLHSQTGQVIHSTASSSDSRRKSLGVIRCAAVDNTFEYVVTTGDDKKLRVWRVEGLELLSDRELPKKPTALWITKDAKTILVSDKFGDIFSYSLHHVAAVSQIQRDTSSLSEAQRDHLASHENPSGGTLVLGHTSLLTTFLLTPDERYIITADRDEHIRVSWYPQGYNIERYCLGHEKFVSAIHLPSFAPETLISGGGDATLKIWNWMNGSLERELSVLDSVLPYIKIKPPKRKRFEDEGEERRTQRQRRRDRKAKAKGQGKADAKDVIEENNHSVASEEPPDLSMTPPTIEEFSETIFVLQKIDSFDFGGERVLLFSAVGSTALSFCPYSSSSQEQLRHFDFAKPVLDFVLSKDGAVWVLLDGGWTDSDPDKITANVEQKAVRLLQWTNETFVESDNHTSSALLLALNSSLVQIVSPRDLSALDLYAALSVMPKNLEAEYNAMDRDGDDGEMAGSDDVDVNKKKQSGRLQARNKKRALVQEVGQKGQTEEPRNKEVKTEHKQDGISNVAMEQ